MNSQRAWPTAGLRVGRTTLTLALVDADGRVLCVQHHPCNRDEPGGPPAADIITLAWTILGGISQKACALGIAADEDIDAAALSSQVKMPVTVASDIRAATWGEWQYGEGRDLTDFVFLAIGEEVSGAVVSGGRFLEGASSVAGGLGHINIEHGGRRCRCPNRGCLEAYVSGWAFAERAREAAKMDPLSSRALIALAGGLETISVPHIAAASRNDDPLACDLLRETAEYLAAGLVSIVNIFNPRRLILGGSVVEDCPELVANTTRTVRARALPAAVQNLSIVSSALGHTAALVGAAALARRSLMEEGV